VDATHLLRFQDISTPQDRNHWVARGQITLRRRVDDALIAEYVGLFASTTLDSNYQTNYWEHVKPCPGPESAYIKDEGTGRSRFNAMRFFFKEVVVVGPGAQAKR
jgi:hypothetical protein